MRWLLTTILLLLFSLTMVAQPPDWQHVDVNICKLDADFAPAPLTASQKRKIERFLSRHLMPDSDECVSLPERPGPTFSIAPVGRSNIYVVRSGRGCGGGAGNAPAWLVDARSEEPKILADIYGWGLEVQQHTSHGFHDFVTGWSMGAGEFGLSYYRYGGAVYRKIGHREVVSCEGRGKHTQ